MQLGVAAGQPHGVAFGQGCVIQGREEHHARAQLLQRLQVGRVGKAKRGITPHGHGAARKQGGYRRCVVRRREVHRPALQVLRGHLAQRGGGQGIGRSVQALGAVGQLVCRHQAQVALGQQGGALFAGGGGIAMAHAHQRAHPVGAVAQAIAQHLRMPLAAHAVGQHTRPGHAGAVVLQAKGQRAKSARHGRCIDHRQHRHAKVLCQVGRAGGAVEQAHHAFDEDEVVALRRSMQALAAVGLAIHPQVQLVHRLAAGELVPVRVQKVWPALEHLHAKTPARMQPRQRRRHRGLALPRGRGGNQQSGAAGGGLCHGIPGRWCGHWGAHFRPTNSVRPGVA